MRSTGRIALSGVLFVFSSALLADESDALYTPASLPSADAAFAATLLDELETNSSWRLPEPVSLTVLADLQLHALEELHFEDSDLVSRLGRLRGVSMLTMAEVGTARLFFGVNDKGLVGLHFNTGASDPDDHHVEMWRMPYLDSEIEPVEAAED